MKRRNKVLLLILAVCIPISYALYTGHVWEDFYITFKFSRNLAEGRGLVYQAGERVHGFTSPLGVLLPALTFLIGRSDESALWLFRIFFAIPAFAGAAYFLVKSCEKIFSEHVPAVYFCALLFIFDAKSVMFSVNGMETAFMLFFLAWLLRLALCGMDGRWMQAGLCWAGLMWTRPDSCVYIAAFALASFLFLPVPRKSQLILFAKAGLLSAALYLPWFVWTWSYYGSPVPHTVIAKNAFYLSKATLFEQLAAKVSALRHAPIMAFLPVYPQFGRWPLPFFIFAVFCGWLCVIAWLAPLRSNVRVPVRFLSFLFFLLCLYLAYIRVPYPWYLPPVTLVGIILLCGLVVEIVHRWSLHYSMCAMLFSALLLCFISLFYLEAERMKAQQSIVEEGNRKRIGLWLAENTGVDDRVFLEPLGYIGYFSGRKMLDFPGLCSPEVVKVIKEKKAGYVRAVEELSPEWVVAREFEARRLTGSAFFRSNYLVAAEFDVREKIFGQKLIHGVDYLLYDSAFYVFRKKREEKR